MLSETLAQYSALMLMKREYGEHQVRRFLRYELDRYLRGRGGELIEELPLMRVENQAYIHYSKGSLIFYRLREEIGEEALNRALANFIRDKAFQQPPYTTTLEMLDYDAFRAEQGSLLSRFACFETLRHKFKQPWWEWPAEWRQPDWPTP